MCLCSAEPLSELRTHHKLLFFLLSLSISLSFLLKSLHIYEVNPWENHFSQKEFFTKVKTFSAWMDVF